MNIRRALPFLVALLTIAGSSGCGSGGIESAATGVLIDVAPKATETMPGDVVRFAATVTGTANTAVQWAIAEAAGGTIDATGNYVAPATVGTYHVVATSVADPTATGTATVSVSTAPVTQPMADCATAPLRTTGTTYYVCNCQTGADPACSANNAAASDSNAGTSPTAPLRTMAAARTKYNAMNGGDTIAFCRGGAWDEDVGFGSNSRCSASATCDLRDYVPSWASISTARPRLNIGGTTFFSASSSGHNLWNLDVRNVSRTTWQPQAAGRLFSPPAITDPRYVDICNVRADGGDTAISLNTSATDDHHNTVRYSQFYRYYSMAIFGGGPGFRVTNNYFENNGLAATPQNHTAYLVATPTGYPVDGAPGTSVVFSNNEVVDNWNCGGVQVVVHGIWLNMSLDMDNNKVTNTSTNANCYAIQAAGSAAAAEFHNLHFRRNRTSTGSGQPGLEVGCCIDCTATDNIVVGGAISVARAGCNGGPGGNRDTVQNNTVYNNTLYLGSQGTGHIVENNAVFGEGTCFSVGTNTARYDSNFCRTAGGPAVGSVFVNAANGDFQPASGGPLIGTANQTYYSPVAIGTATWSPSDNGIQRAAPIDIGACQ